MTQLMLFMAYTLRADSEDRGYNEWLRAVDNPFFAAQTHVQHYSNWKIVDPTGGDLPFTHFDFMELTPGSGPLDVLGAPEVQAFVGEWTRQWGRSPGGPPADNCHCYLVAAQYDFEVQASDRVLMAFDDSDALGEEWRVVSDLMGESPFKAFRRRYLGSVSAQQSGVLAERIAPWTIATANLLQGSIR